MGDHTTHSARNRVDALFGDLGKSVGIPQLALEKDGACVLSFNDLMVTLSFDEKLEAVTFFTILDRLPGPLGAEGLAGLLALNDEMFEKERACIIYNETTLLVAQTFRIDVARLADAGLLPWIDRCIKSVETSRLAVWDLLAADRESSNDEAANGAAFRL